MAATPTNPACKSFIPQLSPFIDGELGASERQAIERHLAACKDCSARVADLRAESGLVRLGLEMAADDVNWDGFAQKVLARVTPEKAPLMERIRISMSEMFLYQRGALISGFAVAAALALVVTTVVVRQKPLPTAGYAQDTMAVETVETDKAAHVAPVVMESDQGKAIIWLVDHPAQNDPDRAGDDRGEEMELDQSAKVPAGKAPVRDGGTPNEGGGEL